ANSRGILLGAGATGNIVSQNVLRSIAGNAALDTSAGTATLICGNLLSNNSVNLSFASTDQLYGNPISAAIDFITTDIILLSPTPGTGPNQVGLGTTNGVGNGAAGTA